jgi:LacI family transcriptional regulator
MNPDLLLVVLALTAAISLAAMARTVYDLVKGRRKKIDITIRHKDDRVEMMEIEGSNLTDERIRRIIDELKRNERLLGLVIPDVDNPFYAEVAAGAERAARAENYLLIVANSDSEPANEQSLLRSLCKRGVDGLLVITAPGADHEFLSSEFHMGERVVFIDRPPQHLEADFVRSDNVGGAREAVEHLISHGHTRIGMLVGNTAVSTDNERLQGYKQALALHEIPYDDALVKTCRHVPTAELATQALFELSSPPTAIFAYNNRTAIGALRAINKLQPTTALVGFDDFELADVLALTVEAQETQKLGEIATEILLRRLSGKEFDIQDEIIPTLLIPRGSGEKAPPEPVADNAGEKAPPKQLPHNPSQVATAPLEER